jgi:hypothetical protein
MVKFVGIGIVSLLLVGCSGVLAPKPIIAPAPVSLSIDASLIDPALKEDNKEDFETVLRLLPESMRQDVTFVDLGKDQIYDTSRKARGLSYSAKPRVKVKWPHSTRASRDPPIRLEWRENF